MTFEIENEYLRYVIGRDGRNLHFIDKRTDTDYCLQDTGSSFAWVKASCRACPATAAHYADGRLTVQFGGSGISAAMSVEVERHYFVLEVLWVKGGNVEELVFSDIRLALQSVPTEPFACCALALNLKTNVSELPRATSHLKAVCYPRFGFAGARVALIGCPQGELRQVMKEVVSAAGELPHSPIGGPSALDAPINRGSYLFNFGGVSEETVDEWIGLTKMLGFTQLDFHGGNSFRFGDCAPNPEIYPRGLDSLKAVIDRLHEAGIMAGLHTYSFFIDKKCPWVTPVPDPRLGKDATFALAEPLTAECTVVPVVESTEKMSATTGFFVRNSVTLQIDDELITYDKVLKEPPFAFTGCQRGACGTRAASHAKGAAVHHLKQCFGLFVPDGDSTLFEEVAARTAEVFNECGFDMIYLDALDGEDVLGGAENGWHYGSKFVFELWKRLRKPALMEMATFHHHLWFVRSRMGAWDHPDRSYKKFIDLHCAANDGCGRMFLPAHLGWWALKTWSGPQADPTFPDDIEYLCCKALGTNSGLSLMGIDPSNTSRVPAFRRLAEIIGRWERVRRSNLVPESMKERLRAAGEEFSLIQGGNRAFYFQPVEYAKHKVQGMERWSNVWKVRNRFGRQPLQLRIEALPSGGRYDAAENVVLADFGSADDFSEWAGAEGVSVDIRISREEGKVGGVSGCYTASRIGKELIADIQGWRFSGTEHGVRMRGGKGLCWAMVGKRFSPPVDLSERQALGVWICGDGRGEVLNFQLRSPEHVSGAIGEHYVLIDFTGWRYCELIEPEGERYEEYWWPYGEQVYSVYRKNVNYGQVERLSLWYNNVPPGGSVKCYLSPIKALPLVKGRLINPSVRVGNARITFPVEVESGCYLEFLSMSECRLCGAEGELIGEVEPEGEVPVFEEEENWVGFACETEKGIRARANVTVMSRGEPLGPFGQ